MSPKQEQQQQSKLPGSPTTDAPLRRDISEVSLKQRIDEIINLDSADKEELKSFIDRILQEVNKKEFADPAKLKRWLRNVSEMAPDIFETIAPLASHVLEYIEMKRQLDQEILENEEKNLKQFRQESGE
jgi:hypothetical protein